MDPVTIQKTFAESMLSILKNKNVEMYVGSSGKERQYADYNVSHKETIRGKFVDAFDEVFVIEVTNRDGSSNLIYVNSRAVVAMIEPQNSISIVDSFCDEYERQPK